MRILYITHLTEKNGATTALRNVMYGMVERGLEVGMIAPAADGFICEEARKIGITVLSDYPYPWAATKGQISLKVWLLVQWKVYKLIKSFRPNIVHCNTGVIDYPLLGCLLTRTPMIWHAREYIDKDFRLSVFGGMGLHRLVMKLPFVRCIAITKGVFEHFRLSTSKDIVIYDGVIDGGNCDSTELTVCNRDNPPLKYFLYVGTFNEGKGAHVIFEQFEKVHQKHPDVHLFLACRYDKDSAYYKRCMSIAKANGFEENIRFLGFRTDVYELMKQAVALIVPSHFEGFGFITVEAMYNHCLVIGRNTAGTKEQFDKGLSECGSEIGLRFDRDEQLPELMLRAMTGEYSAMKENARCVIMRYYTSSRNTESIFQFYQKLI